MKTKFYLIVFSCFLILATPACRKHSKEEIINPPEAGKELFVSAASAGSYTKLELQGIAVIKGFANYAPLIQYDVDFFKLTYKTTYNGNVIEASGLLGIPKNTPGTPALLSAQHGTMFSDADAPSNFPTGFSGFELFASAGFVTVIPDFIGYGTSKDIVHPYYDMKHSALAVVDLIKAAKYYLKTQNKSISEKLFLIGYSEGGYVTMAAQKEIETNTVHNLTLTAAAEGAGGYDITGMLAKIATVPTYADPSFLALFIQGYNTTYKYNRPLTDYFSEPYASAIPQLLDGSKNRDQVNSQLTMAPSSLFNTTFYNNLLNPAAETAFKAQVAANSFPMWYPKSPTRMYHGTADEDVFFETSQSTYDKFKAAGATNVTLTPIPNGTHKTSVAPMMLDALPWMKSLAQ
jgi:alpha-beta hydrolase superfamily lysophospholipase